MLPDTHQHDTRDVEKEGNERIGQQQFQPDSRDSRPRKLMPLGSVCDEKIDERADRRIVVQRDQRIHVITSTVATRYQVLDHDDAERLEDKPAE